MSAVSGLNSLLSGQGACWGWIAVTARALSLAPPSATTPQEPRFVEETVHEPQRGSRGRRRRCYDGRPKAFAQVCGTVTTRFDHLVIAATSLNDGVAWVRDRLGATPSSGGRHPRMGTHNHLLRLGAGRYLEVITIDPDAPPPDRPRWFALDQPAMRARLAREPRIICWVARTTEIARVAAHSPIPLGTPEPMSRGALSWLIILTPDGSLPEGGALPSLIEWPAGSPHPTERMPEL